MDHQSSRASSSSHRDRDRDRDRRRSASPSSTSHRHSSTSSRRPRSRSRSPKRSSSSRREKERDRDGSGSEDDGAPPDGVARLDESDFFQKSNELRLWIWEEKHKKFDTLKSEDSRRYFRKFTKKWNQGSLPDKYYQGIQSSSLPTTISSSHSWNFSKATQRELDDASSIRRTIDTGLKPLPKTTSSTVVRMGPTLPSSRVEAVQSSREADRARREEEREYEKRERKKVHKESREEERDNRATGRDRLIEKRREVGGKMRDFKEAKEAGMVELDDEALGLDNSTSSFQAAIAARDRRMNSGRKAMVREEKQAEIQDKIQTMKEKDNATMDMFKRMAAERFGPK